jgi:hypothetical protein
MVFFKIKLQKESKMTIEGVGSSSSALILRSSQEVNHVSLAIDDRRELEEAINEVLLDNVGCVKERLKDLQGRIHISEIADIVPGEEYQIDLKVDLSSMPTLSEDNDLNFNNDLVSLYLNELFHTLNTLGENQEPILRFSIKTVLLNDNNISGRSLLRHFKEVQHSAFGEVHPENAELSYEKLNGRLFDEVRENIRYVDISHTKVTYLGLKYMFVLPKLETIKMDYCRNVTGVIEAASTKCESVTRISIIGSHLCEAKWLLKDLETKFPNIKQVDFTQHGYKEKIHKFVGLSDPMNLQSTQAPHALVPCGHIYDIVNTWQQMDDSCWTCRTVPTEFVDAAIFHTRLKKGDDEDSENEIWKVRVLDFTRRPLDSNTYYHPTCRQAFNVETLSGLFKEKFSDVIAEDIVRACSDKECPGCKLQGRVSKLELLPIFPSITETHDELEQSQMLSSLYEMSEYTI